MPSHTRYAAPTTVSTVSTSSERATRAATPAATAAVAARCPTNNPPTAGNTVRCRSPAAIAYAQSAPGVNTNNNDTAQNATTVPTVMTSPILRTRRRGFALAGRLGVYARNVLPTFSITARI